MTFDVIASAGLKATCWSLSRLIPFRSSIKPMLFFAPDAHSCRLSGVTGPLLTIRDSEDSLPGHVADVLSGLFNRDAFCQVTRLVDIGATGAGGVIGQQLQRHDVQQR